MTRGSFSPSDQSSRRPPLLTLVRSLFRSLSGRTEGAAPERTPVVALVVGEEDRDVLLGVAGPESLDVRLCGSLEEASFLATELSAPVILLDRDWPANGWREAVQTFASLDHNTCVILLSSVVDPYLWQEVIRWRGYDVLPKPLRPESVRKIIRLAVSYWASANPSRKAGSPLL